MWTFKMYSRNTKTTNQPTASNNKSDKLQVNIWDTWKTLKYLNISDSFHLKDLEISKYKRESKARMPIKFCCLIFVNCGFLNHRRAWHGPPPVLFTHLFSIKFLYFYIISSLFSYFNLFVPPGAYIFWMKQVPVIISIYIGSTHAIWC